MLSSVIGAPARYWHTIRFLKPVQIVGRIRHRLARPQPDMRSPPPLSARTRAWITPVSRSPVLTGPTRMRVLNEEHDIDEAGWDDPRLAKLWRYNLHYFDDLHASGAKQRAGWHRLLLLRWIKENPPGRGTGWEPYPTSLRIVGWIKWAMAGAPLSPAIVQSLAVQIRWLTRRVEWHLLGNHLLANAKALVMAGLFFEGDEAQSWLSQGLALYDQELPEQILADGGHFELSPMYHAIVAEDLLDLLNMVRAFPGRIPPATVERWQEVTDRMRAWLAVMSHPDGGPSFFNDAALGIAPTLMDLEDYAARLGRPPLSPPADGTRHLPQSGYVRVQHADAVLLADVGAIGPDYIPGHAHADSLSFELSLHGQRVLVNTGTSIYARCAERRRQRSTAAHNTIEIDGEDSSEVWGAFRVARRARPFDVRVENSGAATSTFSGAHDGYLRLPGRAVHRRSWHLQEGSLTVEDTIAGRFARARSFLRVRPGIGVTVVGNTARLDLPDGLAVTCRFEGGTLREVPSTWHPQFGVTEPTRALVLTLDGAHAKLICTW